MRNSRIFRGGMLDSSYAENCTLALCEISQSRLVGVRAEESYFIGSDLSDAFYLDASALKKTAAGILVHKGTEYPISGLREHPLFRRRFANRPDGLSLQDEGIIAFRHLKKERAKDARDSSAI